MSYTICIARFDEDVSWAKSYATNVVVCNKGDELQTLPQSRIPNLGREGYAYLRYIVDHYDCLSDITIFAQGRLNDHLDIYGDLNFNDENALINHMLMQCKMFGHSMNAKSHRLGFCSAHPNFKLAQRYPNIVDSARTFGEWFESNVRRPFVSEPKWFKNAVFGVSKEHVRSRPSDYYESLLNQFTSSGEHEICHYLERSWFYIFNLDRPVSRVTAASTMMNPSKFPVKR